MTNLYHDQLDAFEARVRAEEAERELNEAETVTIYDHPFTQAEVEADYQEHKDLYNMGMGA